MSAALRYRLEAEWRNKFPGERVLDRSDLFEVERASLLREVASLVLIRPAQWLVGECVCVCVCVCAMCVCVCVCVPSLLWCREEMFYECLWRKMAPHALETILMEASQAE